MRKATTVVPGVPEQVFRLLSDPMVYAHLVPGSRRVRGFDRGWPEPGTRFDHSLGAGFTVIRDQTTSVERKPPGRLVVTPGLGPLGRTETTFMLVPVEGGTRVEVGEVPTSGPVAAPGVRRVTEAMLWVRNLELLRRLRVIAERCHAVTARPST